MEAGWLGTVSFIRGNCWNGLLLGLSPHLDLSTSRRLVWAFLYGKSGHPRGEGRSYKNLLRPGLDLSLSHFWHMLLVKVNHKASLDSRGRKRTPVPSGRSHR